MIAITTKSSTSVKPKRRAPHAHFLLKEPRMIRLRKQKLASRPQAHSTERGRSDCNCQEGRPLAASISVFLALQQKNLLAVECQIAVVSLRETQFPLAERADHKRRKKQPRPNLG